jgi:hypothetical protein
VSYVTPKGRTAAAARHPEGRCRRSDPWVHSRGSFHFLAVEVSGKFNANAFD